MHLQSNSDVTGFTESSVLCRIMSLAEMINAVAKGRFGGKICLIIFQAQIKRLQVSDDDVGGSRRVVRGNRYVPARLVTQLGQLPDRVPLHRYVGAGNLDQR